MRRNDGRRSYQCLAMHAAMDQVARARAPLSEVWVLALSFPRIPVQRAGGTSTPVSATSGFVALLSAHLDVHSLGPFVSVDQGRKLAWRAPSSSHRSWLVLGAGSGSRLAGGAAYSSRMPVASAIPRRRVERWSTTYFGWVAAWRNRAYTQSWGVCGREVRCRSFRQFRQLPRHALARGPVI